MTETETETDSEADSETATDSEADSETETETETEADSETDSETDSDAASAIGPRAAPRRPWGAYAFIGGQGAVGVTPGLGGGLELGGAAWRGRWALELSGSGALRTSTTHAPGQVSAAAWWGTARACRGRLVGPLVACASVALGQVRGRGDGFVVSSSDTSLLAMTGARLGARLRLGRGLHVVPYVEVHGHLLRTSLRVDDEVAWRTPAVQVAAGVVLSLGSWH
jgi:hypothetical protein